MMINKLKIFLIIIPVLGLFLGCPPVETPDLGHPPKAVTGEDLVVETGVRVLLSAEGSYDEDGDEISFNWTFDSVPASSALSNFDIFGAAMSLAGFTPDVDGRYIVKLTVSDSEYDATDTIIIDSISMTPTAYAGLDKSTLVDEEFSLDGSGSTDPNGDTLTYTWTLTEVPDGCSNTTDDIINANSAVCSFNPNSLGFYTFSLAVSDGERYSSDSVIIHVVVTIHPPVANAGDDASVETGYPVPLDGTASSDADGDLLNYLWTFENIPAGSSLNDSAIIGITSATASFIPDVDGVYELILTVNDGGIIDSDTVVVTAMTGIMRPTADAGVDMIAETGYIVNGINGGNSTDPNGDVLTYQWEFLDLPMGSGLNNGNISAAGTAVPTFSPDTDGSYVLQLLVSDGTYTHADSVTVTASTGCFKPTADAGADIVTDYGLEVILDGSGATDPNGDSLTYLWSMISVPSGSVSVLSNTGSTTPSFVPDTIGEYIISCQVSDGTYSDSDEIIVTATPIYMAGDTKVLTVDGIDIVMHYIPEGLSFPIEITDSDTYGSSDPLSSEYQPAYWAAETEATNELVVAVLNWALDNGRLADAVLNPYTLTLDGQILLDLVDANCQIEYDGISFSVITLQIPNQDITTVSVAVDDTVSQDALTAYLNGESQPSIDLSKYPCTEITWFGAIMVSNWLTEMYYQSSENIVYSHTDSSWTMEETSADYSKNGFRLPESMEWECAARYIGSNAPAGQTNYLEVGGLYWTDGESPSGGVNHVADYKIPDHPFYDNPMLDVGWYLLNAHETDIDGQPSSNLVFHDEGGARASDGALLPEYEGGCEVGSFEVAKKQPNALGIYDMSGNVWEMCYTEHPLQSGDIIRRGGGFPSHYMFLQVGRILDSLPTYSENLHGFRLFMSE